VEWISRIPTHIGKMINPKETCGKRRKKRPFSNLKDIIITDLKQVVFD
jgi:hypothetical protein